MTLWPFTRRPVGTFRLNGHDVPEPMRTAPEHGSVYWVAEFGYDLPVTSRTWAGQKLDRLYLRRGLVQATKEGAIAHSQALLSFTDFAGGGR